MTMLPLVAALQLALSTPALAQDPWPGLDEAVRLSAQAPQDAAVIVAIEDYTNVDDVPGAGRNATDWHAFFTESLGLPETRVFLLRDHDGTDAQIKDAVARARAALGEGGRLWFVFIGHGAPAMDGQGGVLVGADAGRSATGIYSRSLSVDELLDRLEQDGPEETIVLLDACFSGLSPSGKPLVEGLQPLLPVAARTRARATLLTAAQADQFAGPLPGGARPAFSYLALGGLRGWADADQDGAVTTEELSTYAGAVLAVTVRDRQQASTHAGPARALPAGKEKGPDLGALVVQTARAGRVEAERKALLDRAAQDWSRTMQAVQGGGDEGQAALRTFLHDYEDAGFVVDGERNTVVVPQVALGQEILRGYEQAAAARPRPLRTIGWVTDGTLAVAAAGALTVGFYLEANVKKELEAGGTTYDPASSQALINTLYTAGYATLGASLLLGTGLVVLDSDGQAVPGLGWRGRW